MSNSNFNTEAIEPEIIDQNIIDNSIIQHRPIPIKINGFKKPVLIWVEMVQRKQTNPIYIMDDNGQTLYHYLNQNHQIATIHEILNHYQVRNPDDRLIIHSDQDHIMQKLTDLLNAIIKIKDLSKRM